MDYAMVRPDDKNGIGGEGSGLPPGLGVYVQVDDSTSF